MFKMSLSQFHVLYSEILLKQLTYVRYTEIRSVAKLASKKLPNENRVIISCKRPQYDHYSNSKYDKLDEIVLASKGWNHSKAKNDYFIVHPNPETCDERPKVPFSDIDIHTDLIKGLHTQNITEATALQNEAISVISKENHTVLAAETGCGKTLAYLLPVLNKLVDNKVEKMNAPKALIVLPNRELAYQIGSVANPLAQAVGLKIKVMVGGRVKKFMLNPEFSEVDVLIATPGVISKLSGVGLYRLNNVLYTVLDEADTLIDDSFVEKMTGIIKRVSQSQLTLVSATLPKQVPSILEPYQPNFVYVTSPMLHKPLWNITQQFIRLIRSLKPTHILKIAKGAKEPLLIFTNRNETCNWLSIFLNDNGLKCARINGNMNYAVRIEEWNKFIMGEVKILIATDVGSRGLDTTQIKHVVNYDFPLYAADYLHRIGRTGRFGSLNCKVTNFISGPEEVQLVQKIELAIRRNEAIANVDGNITRILQKRILRKMREDDLE